MFLYTAAFAFLYQQVFGNVVTEQSLELQVFGVDARKRLVGDIQFQELFEVAGLGIRSFNFGSD